MVALKLFLASSVFSRHLFRDMLHKCSVNKCCNTERWFSMIKSIEGQYKSYSICLSVLKAATNRSLSSTVAQDPEFVSETIIFPNENVDFETLSEMVNKMQSKTGVIVKTPSNVNREKTEDGKSGWKVLIGGTQHEVQKAVFYIKSLLNKEPRKQRLMMLQDEKTNQPDSEKLEKTIWAYYRRNFKGQKPPMKTRKKCIRGQGDSQIVSGNPCPICRLYLGGGYQLDCKDTDLLSQFISPHTGEVFEATKTGLCRVQQENLVMAIEKAKDYGLLPYTIPGPRTIAKRQETVQIPRNVRLK